MKSRNGFATTRMPVSISTARGRKVLVVDDDENLNVLLCKIFHALGFVRMRVSGVAAVLKKPFAHLT